jgi:predicted nucleic acid-binding protein
MKPVLADSLYWIAIAYVRDQWHRQAIKASPTIQPAEIVTTEEVITEFLAAFRYDLALRQAATAAIERMGNNPKVTVLEQSHQTFLDGLALYKARPDKEYSLTDCISMLAMRELGITEILTYDDHLK